MQMQREIQWYNYNRINYIWRPTQMVNTSPLITPEKAIWKHHSNSNNKKILSSNKNNLIPIEDTVRNLNDDNIHKTIYH